MADFAEIGSDYTERWLEGVLDDHQARIASDKRNGKYRGG